MYQMEKIQQVCHTPRQRWGRDTGYCSCWTKSLRPSGWQIGVLGSLLFGLLTYLTNLYFKLKKTGVRRRGESRR